MPDPRARRRLLDILDEIGGIRSVTVGLSFAEFDRSWAALRAKSEQNRNDAIDCNGPVGEFCTDRLHNVVGKPLVDLCLADSPLARVRDKRDAW